MYTCGKFPCGANQSDCTVPVTATGVDVTGTHIDGAATGVDETTTDVDIMDGGVGLM